MPANTSIKLRIDHLQRSVTIGTATVTLPPIQYCYYLFFARRAKQGLSFLTMNKGSAPDEFSLGIADIYERSFPDNVTALRTMYSNSTKGVPVNIMTTVLGHITKLNRRIPVAQCRIVHRGAKKNRSYGIELPPESIDMATESVIPTFAQKLHIFAGTDSLEDVLRYMKKHQYSQVVYRPAHRLMLITPESLMEWLQQTAVHRKRLPEFSDILLSSLPLAVDESTVFFCKPSFAVNDARRLFHERFLSDAPRLSAVIITSNGHSTGEPLGIITPWDFIDPKHW